MIWPNATDYNAAVQNPQLCFGDDDLRQGQAVGDLFGLPRPHSGNFADVYQIQGVGGQSWAVKCFTRPVAGLRPRYQAICDHLRHTQRAFMVEFHFLDEGICIRGQWHPLVKMRWIEGLRLNEFVREHLKKPALLERLAQLWVRLAQELRDADMAHGDLQHGNVLLVPGSKSSSLALKLIDYDGMFVPALADHPSGEVGHPNYQHPRRLREGGYDRDMDRFAHLLIYTALRCLRIGGEELWQRYDNLENLLFREQDFRQPSQSRLLHELWEIQDHEVRGLVGHLLLASQGPLEVVPALDELVDDSGIRPLSDSEEGQINELLDGGVSQPSRDHKGAVAMPLPYARGSALSGRSKLQTAAHAVEPIVDTLALTDTKPISLGAKTIEAPAPAPPPLPRRSAAEIERDAQPPAPVAAHSPFDVALLTDPLVSMLSHPAWLATLGLIALVSFLVVNVMVWSSVKEPAVENVAALSPVLGDKKKEKTIPPPIREAPRPLPPPVQQQRAPSTPKPRNAAPPQERTSPKRLQEIQKPRVRLKDETPKSLALEAGATGELRIFLDRSGYQGKVEVQLTELPNGVTAQPAVVLAAERRDGDPPGSAALTVETKVDADQGEHRVKLLVRANEQTVDVRGITLSIGKPHGRQERVHFSTIDHMQLAGTLYHGWKGKRGMTVLMLHDIGSNRSTPGWKRLAEALQSEGHTVLTFDFRGHGGSKKVSPKFWNYSVNKYLPSHEPGLTAENQPRILESDSLPAGYMPWLVEDIAAARTYLDLRQDDPENPVNTFNLVVIGAGQASALGSLWLATEGLRYNASEIGNKILLKWEEKRSVLQAVWIGMADPLKLRPFGVHGWLEGAHAKPVVPITFIYGEDDVDTATLLSVPIREKLGNPHVLPNAGLPAQQLLDNDAQAAARIQRYLVKTLQELPPGGWVPRNLKTLRSFWKIPLSLPGGREHVRWFVAKRPGDETLLPVPFQPLNIPPIRGLSEPASFVPE